MAATTDDPSRDGVAVARWRDLVPPGPSLRALHEIARQARRHTPGLVVLFTGRGSTGKALAATVLARELGLPLHRVDLSAVVGTYIGETEKNLARTLRRAEESDIVLLFDEADALFGKRRNAGPLFRRLLLRRGLTILSAGQKEALDAAILRRLRHIVEFPSAAPSPAGTKG